MILRRWREKLLVFAAVGFAFAAGWLLGGGTQGPAGQAPFPVGPGEVLAQSEAAPAEGAAESDTLVVPLCDGETRLEVEGVEEGEVLSEEQAPLVAQKLMEMHEEKQQREQQASKWTKRDRLIWEREQKRLVEEGDRLFHDWKALGGTIGISCDMCHPNAAGTHPETYPKFQTQLKRVGALRDMINWCIENPMKGEPLALDDPRMLAVEAYITSTREGVPLAPGKH